MSSSTDRGLSVSVIIVNYNAGDRLLRCLAALKAQTLQPLEIIVVDNGSSDHSLEEAVAAHPDIVSMPMGENLGFAAGNNRAAVKATGDWLALINPDAYAEPDWLEQLVGGIERWPKAKAFGSTQLDAANPALIDGAGDNFHALGVPYRGHLGWTAEDLPEEGVCLSPCAAAALIERKTFQSLGGFDERFFCYCEDVDLGIRLHHAGHVCVQVPSAKVHHEGSAITGRSSAFTVFHGHRNRIWLNAKAMPALLFWAMLPFQLLVNLVFVLKFAPTRSGRSYRRGILAGLSQIAKFRRERRAHPSLSSFQFAPLLVWSPLALIRRRGKITVAEDQRVKS